MASRISTGSGVLLTARHVLERLLDRAAVAIP
jgi:hypothetical protein